MSKIPFQASILKAGQLEKDDVVIIWVGNEEVSPTPQMLEEATKYIQQVTPHVPGLKASIDWGARILVLPYYFNCEIDKRGKLSKWLESHGQDGVLPRFKSSIVAPIQ